MELFKITEDHQSLREAGALDHALGYVRERWQFGKRIADFQGIQFMLADMVMPRRPPASWSTPRPPST